ncbi:MAG: PDZ domain-containing protein [Flavobacteriales bacterium]|nr:PDZ domain-containing protein [Flavobacteriales bacterium]
MKSVFFFSILSLLTNAAALAQDKASIQITRNINGKTEVITKEIELLPGQSIDDVIKDMGLFDDIQGLSDEQSIEIEIDRDMNAPAQIYLGLELYTAFDEGSSNSKCVIAQVLPNSPAQEAGLLASDIVMSVAGQSITHKDEFLIAIKDFAPNDLINIEVYREQAGELFEFWVKAAERPHNDLNQFFNFDQFNLDSSMNTFFNFEQFFANGFPFGDRQMWSEEDKDTPFLGVSPSQQKSSEGVLIGAVTAESAAEMMGLMKGDVILELNKEKINAFEELAQKIKSMNVGDVISLKIKREGKKMKLDGVLGTKPSMKFGNNFVFPDFEGLNENGEWFFDFEFDGLPDDAMIIDNQNSNGELYIDSPNEDELQVINQKRKSNQQLSTNKPLNPKTLSLFPNGTQLEINFSLKDAEAAQLLIIDEKGKTVAEYFLSNSSEVTQEVIDFNSLKGNEFYIQIKQGEKQFCRKIQVEK